MFSQRKISICPVSAIRDCHPLALLAGNGEEMPGVDLLRHIDVKHHGARKLILGQFGQLAADLPAERFAVLLTPAGGQTVDAERSFDGLYVVAVCHERSFACDRQKPPLRLDNLRQRLAGRFTDLRFLIAAGLLQCRPNHFRVAAHLARARAAASRIHLFEFCSASANEGTASRASGPLRAKVAAATASNLSLPRRRRTDREFPGFLGPGAFISICCQVKT